MMEVLIRTYLKTLF